MNKDLPAGVGLIFFGALFIGLAIIFKNGETVSGQPQPWNLPLLVFLVVGLVMTLYGSYDLYIGGDKLRATKYKKEAHNEIEAALKYSSEIIKLPDHSLNRHSSALARFFMAPRMNFSDTVELRPNGCLELRREGRSRGIYGSIFGLIFCTGLIIAYLKTKQILCVPIGLYGFYLFSVMIRMIYRRDKILVGEHEIVFIREGRFGNMVTRFPRGNLSGVNLTRRSSGGKHPTINYDVTINLRKTDNVEKELFIYSSLKIEVAEEIRVRLCEHLSLPKISNGI